MPQSSIHQCQCPHCQSDTPHPDQALHRQMNVFLSRLDEQQRRWYAALEASRLGHGGDQHVARITGLNVPTIRRGRQELASELGERPADRVRTPGAGRPLGEKKPRCSNRPCSTWWRPKRQVIRWDSNNGSAAVCGRCATGWSTPVTRPVRPR